MIQYKKVTYTNSIWRNLYTYTLEIEKLNSKSKVTVYKEMTNYSQRNFLT